MNNDILVLTATAASIGFFHTLLGPDHYLPFIAISRARGWSRRKTMLITALCGLGHVLSSVVLGALGLLFGIAVLKLENIESVRGTVAAWSMIAFGLVYCAWGIRRAIRNKPHTHGHGHGDMSEHEHEHIHQKEHIHPHDSKDSNLTPWVLFAIFVFGPCEPLIPILMYPAAINSISGLCIVTSAFSVITIATMLGTVHLISTGIRLVPLKKLERYSHALAGASILMCGLAIEVLGL